SRPRRCRWTARRRTGRGHADMNGPLDISVDTLAEEAVAFQRKLGAGLDTLREVGDFDYGATAKEEVWRDGKVVLYRFLGENAPTAKVPLLISYALVNR